MSSLCSLVICVSILFFVGWTDAARVCNNSPDLCSKLYDTVTYLGAHNSPFIRDASTGYSSFGNQFFSTTKQLDAGVRFLTAQVHVDLDDRTGKRELHLCHSSCSLFDVGRLRDWLLEIREWMEANPNDIVTVLLVNSDGVDAREIEGVYSEADIARYGYVPSKIDQASPSSNQANATWPALNEMIDNKERLVSLINPLKPDVENAPYLLDQYTFTWENAYEVTDPSNFTCMPDRPEKQTIDSMLESGRLFIMNHLLYWQQAFGIHVPDIRNVNTTNGWDGPGALGQHMVDCGNRVTRAPTYVLVDFFNVGPAIETVDIFNKVTKPLGRMQVPQKLVGGGAGLRFEDMSEKFNV
ncbi:hypothetical protein CC78DRAFT_566919 [Lojkania enalia]|uniref:PLC-like phosphodiesterase n=1 Tax=Lojkania enalia TaxID=147567 RepID=A0A9P4KDN9_9PLEO|nr:hypothetical protein CC78DRAFT_566919 [Didymosphaeria enalia]